jgi:hypothetical protein
MLEEAQHRSQDRTTIGRHIATILLDGACDYAMGLAATHLGLPRHGQPRGDSFHVRYKELVNRCGNSWAARSWTGVSELHESRNMAQHRGTSVDADDLSRWSADADSFVRSLCTEVFHVELRDIALADAIVTETVRSHLLDAETAITDGEATRAFASAMAALDEARERWRMQRSDAHGLIEIATGRYAPGQGDQSQVARAIQQIQDIVEMQPFAADLGEYVWLQARRAESELPEGLISLDDASRAFRFAFFWSLRWEVFASRYTPRRWPERASTEPPRSGQDRDQPLIWALIDVEGTRTQVDREPIFTISLQLADVPTTHRDRWAQLLEQALVESAPKEASGLPTYHGRVGENGIVRLFQVPGESDPSDVIVHVNNAIEASQVEFERFLAEQEDWSGRYDELVEPYRLALAPITFGDGQQLLGRIGARGQTDDFIVVAELAIERNEWTDHDVLVALSHQVGGYDRGVEYANRALSFRSSFTPDRAAELARAIATDVFSAQSNRAAAQHEVDTAQAELRDGLQQLIAAQRGAGIKPAS